MPEGWRVWWSAGEQANSIWVTSSFRLQPSARPGRVAARTRRGSNVRRLGQLDCTSSVHDSKKIRLAPCTTAAALKLGSLLDCKRHMVDVTLDLRGGLEGDRLPTNDARHHTADDHLLTCDHPRYFALLTDYNFSSHHVALDLAVYLKDTAADDLQPLADDLEVVPDDGFLTS